MFLLRKFWSNKMHLKKVFIQSVGWRGIYLATAFLLNIVISRYFEASGSGWIYYLSNNLSFILLLASLSLESATTFYGSRGEIALNKLSTLSFGWAFLATIVVTTFLSVYYLSNPQKYSFSVLLLFSVSYIWGVLLSSYYNALFYARQNFVIPNLVLAIINCLLVLILPIAEWLFPKTFKADFFLYYYFGGFLVQGLIIAYIFNRKYTYKQPLVLPDRTEYKKLLSYSSRALLANVVFFIVYRADYWFIEKMCKVCSPDDLGNYIQVSKIIQLFLILPSILSSAIFPTTVAGFKKQVNSILPIMSRSILGFYSIVLLLLAVIGKWLFPYIYGSTFDQMWLPFIISIPGILSLSILSFLAAYNAGKDKISINLKGAIFPIIVIVAGDFIFIPNYGIVAAAAVSSIAYCCYMFYVLFIFSKEYQVPCYQFFLLKRADLKHIRELLLKKSQASTPV